MASLTMQARPQMRASSLHSRKRKRPLGRVVGDIFTYLFLIVTVVLTLYPLFWMIISSLKPAGDILNAPLSLDLGQLSFSSYSALFASIPIWVGFKNTLIVMIFKGGLTMFFCPLAGFAFAKFRFRGRDFLFSMILATFMLPFVVMIIPLFLEMGTLNWVDTYAGLIIPGAVGAFGIFWMRQSIAEIPDELLDAGRVDGCSAFGLFWSIVVPIIRPALAALAILTFLGIYNDFIWPVIITNSNDMQTLQVLLYSLSSEINNAQPGLNGGNVWGEVLAASTIATVPVLILFVAMQRQFIRGILAGGLKG